MSSITISKSTLTKAELQASVESHDLSISFKKPSNVRSECWTNFSLVYHANIPQEYIICLECKTLLKWTSVNGTRVMTHHNCLKYKPVLMTPPRQRTISSYCQQTSLSKEYPLFKKRILEACVEYCASDGRSFESVTGGGFINLAKQLISVGASLGTSVTVNELLPHPSTISIISRNVEHMYLNMKKQLISLCEPLKYFAITCDFWSEKSTGIHYGGLSLHFIDSLWCLRVFTLSCQAYDFESQHAINLRLFVDRILQEFGLFFTNDIYITTDNENKMKAAFRDDVQRIGCSAHYVNKILQHAFFNEDTQCDAAKSIFNAVRAVVSKVRQCHKQSLLSTYLQNYCDTRFSGVYIMLHSFLKVFYELPAVLHGEQKRLYLQVDHEDSEALCSYLKHFYDVIEKLSCEKTPTIHLVIPYKQFLITKSDIDQETNQLLLPLKQYIRETLRDYWVVHDVHYIATMLHPNLKAFSHTPHQKNHAEALLKAEFGRYQQLEQQQLLGNNNNKKIQQNKKVHVSTSLEDISDLPAPSDELQDDTEIKSELDKYLEDQTKINKDANVLLYWSDNKLLYPVLAMIAQRVLSIPATNTSVERLFSDSGNTVTNRRTRLQTSKVNQLLFIRRNLSTLKELFPPSIEELKKRKNSSSSPIPMKKRKNSKGEEDNDSSILVDDLDNSLLEDHDKENEICNN